MKYVLTLSIIDWHLSAIFLLLHKFDLVFTSPKIKSLFNVNNKNNWLIDIFAALSLNFYPF